MKIENYIDELLYENNCVIIPGFGGFIGNYQSSSIHPVQHVFSPPAKKIAFNIRLTHDDGLLAGAIARNEGVDFDVARQKIAEFVKTCMLELERNKKISFHGVGELYYDIEKNLLFRDDASVNHLTDSFGLSAIQSPPVKREDILEVISRQRMENITARPIGKNRGLVRKVAFGGVASGIAAALVFAAIRTDFFNGTQPYDQTSVATVITANPVRNAVAPAAPSVANVPSATDTTVPSKPTPDLSEEVNGTSAGTHSFYIIAGAFMSKQNALNMVQTLQRQGYPASLVGKNEKGFFLVAFNGADDRISAVNLLRRVQGETSSSAWLYSLSEAH